MTAPVARGLFWGSFSGSSCTGIRIETRFDITEILCREGVWIVFRMAGYKGNTLIFAGKQVSIAIFCFGGDSRSV